MAYVFGSTFVCQSIDAAKEVLKSLVAFCAFYIVVEDIFFDKQTYSFCSVEYILNFFIKRSTFSVMWSPWEATL